MFNLEGQEHIFAMQPNLCLAQMISNTFLLKFSNKIFKQLVFECFR